MRPLVSATVAALSFSLAAPAVGQSYSSSSSSPFYYNGFIAMDYVRTGTNSVTAGLIDLAFGIQPTAYGSFGGIGFEFGVWGYNPDFGGSNDDLTAFAALTFALGGGILHVGAPRSAVRGYVDTPTPTGARAGLLELGIYNATLPYSTIYAVMSDRPVIGLMYERESAGLRYSASYGRLRNSGTDINVLGFGFEREFGDSRAFGTLERLWASGGSITTYAIGGSTMIGGEPASLRALEIGGNLTLIDQSGTTATTASLYTTASVTDRLDLTASLLHLRMSSSSDTIYGVNARYNLWNDVELNAGVGRATGGGSTLWTFGLSRDF